MSRNRQYDPEKIVIKKPKQITQEEIDSIRDDMVAAQALLEDKKFTSILSFFKDRKQSILEKTAKRLISDVEEEFQINPDMKRKLTIPAEKEYDMLAGEYRLSESFESYLRACIQIGNEMEEKIAHGELIPKTD